jgi:cytoskeletal protein CcmA (bactofilin family)
MFGRKNEGGEDETAAADSPEAEGTLPLKPVARPAALERTRPAPMVARPEMVRRPPPDLTGSRRAAETNGGDDSRRLIVGREIVLSGSITSCDKLVVEGRVEANLTDCREVEVAETGTFKGSAEIDVAEISGRFEGKLIARELLLVRSKGCIAGSVRYGRLEIERGGEIEGDISVYTPEPVAASLPEAVER